MTAPRTVKIVSSWSDTLRMLLVLHEEGNAEGRAEAWKQLSRMAELADRYVDMANS